MVTKPVLPAKEVVPETEASLTASRGLEHMSNCEIMTLMRNEEQFVLMALEQAEEEVSWVIDRVVESFQAGGRLIYVGAGTSGRLGVLDASECPPTFSVSPHMVEGIIAGGDKALRSAVEGAEDDHVAGEMEIEKRQVNKLDVVVGIAASGGTPFVHGALQRAKKNQAITSLITCVSAPCAEAEYIDRIIRLVVGPEILSGSTRLKAGTATKLALNMISTIAMVRLGKVYDNLMVDLQASNEKLKKRALRIFKELGKHPQQAQEFLAQAHWELKTAIVMSHKEIDYSKAKKTLSEKNGVLSLVLNGE